MASSFLKVEGADVYYGASQILFGVDLAVEQGETMALLGRNGAGKSTTFKMIAGLAPPRRGTVELGGQALAGRPLYRIARSGIGYVPENRQVFPEHSVDDNLIVGAKKGANGESHWSRERTFDDLWRRASGAKRSDKQERPHGACRNVSV